MADFDIDFEGTGGNGNGGQAGGGNQGAGGGTAGNGNGAGNGDVTDLNGGGNADLTSGNGNGNGNGNGAGNGAGTGEGNGNGGNGTGTGEGNGEGGNGEGGNGSANNSSTGELNVGDKIEFENTTYTVAENGDLVDDKGNVFKKADEVKDWMNSLEQEEENNLSIEAIQEALGTEITDESGKPVQFTNDAAGVKAYVDAVVSLKSRELQEGAINKLYADNPLLKQFQDYVTVNGSPVGFGELPDRSDIEINKDNASQQEAIIRMAAKEFGNKSMNDNYIKYLKDTGGLYDEAVAQLKALQDKDKAVRAEIQQRAEAARAKDLEEFNAYWNKVNNVIKGRTIAGYKLPESFVKEVNGKKQTLTPNDFYNYLSRQTEVSADGNRITAYQKDLEDESDTDLLNRELLSAWLMYTGGTYKDLISMAAQEEQVRTLKLRSKQRSTGKTVKVIKPQGGKVDFNDIALD